MTYQAQNFDHLLGLPGFSETTLKNHLTLYNGYVANTNKLIEALTALVKQDQTNTPDFSELKRRFGWEWNGLRLHELYFGNLSKNSTALSPESALNKKLVAEFGSFEAWLKEFKTVGLVRGIGWLVLYEDLSTGALFNTWINEHDTGHLAGAKPILVMDVFEHAFMLDYGLKRADYIEAFVKVIDWSSAEHRLS